MHFVNLRTCCLVLAAVVAAGCGGAPKNKEAIRQGVVEHVTKNSGLDVNAMNVEVTNVEYKGKEAHAAVSFAPKNAPGQGMSMNYTLEQQGSKWVVKGKAGGGTGAAHPGAGMPGQGSGAMPPGHPPTGATGQGNPTDLPAGHPPVGGAKPNPVAPADPTNPTQK
jgi:hypothetical protein